MTHGETISLGSTPTCAFGQFGVAHMLTSTLQDDYRITAFVPGLDRIVGRTLLLDHISDPTTRPLDQLLRDHFLQCLLKHVKGSGEQQWDYARTFGIGSFDLSNEAVWGTEEGKERLELELEERLFDHRLRDQGSGSRPVTPAGLVRV